MIKHLTLQFKVEPEHSAARVGSGLLEILSTPSLLGFMENTARELLQPEVANNQSQVGIEANLKHLAPTAIGKTVHITAQLIEQNKRIYNFEIEAHEGTKLIATAQHKRAIVEEEKFMTSIDSE